MNRKLKVLLANNKARKRGESMSEIYTREDILKRFDKTDLELIGDIIDMKLPLTEDNIFNDNHEDKKGDDLEE